MPIDLPAMPSTTRRPTQRRSGVILVFVIVFLVLLAIIGAAFVSAARVDRMQIGNLGGRTIERDPNIRDIYDQAVEAVLEKLTDDQTLDYDGLSDEFMASLAPRLVADVDGGNLNEDPDVLVAIWPKISRPLGGDLGEDFFIQSPKLFTNGSGFDTWGGSAGTLSPDGRRVVVGDADMTWFDASGVARKRQFPAFRPFDTSTTAPIFRDALNLPTGHRGDLFAADAVGDGIADAGMTPIVLNDDPGLVGTLDRYQSNGLVYLVGYKVVDKNAQLNLNTAGSRDGLLVDLDGDNNLDTDDINFEAITNNGDSDLGAPDVFGPTFDNPQRFGFFRHDIGLIEMFEFAGLNPVVINAPGVAQYATHREFHTLAKARLGLNNDEDGYPQTQGQMSAFPLDVYNNNPTESPFAYTFGGVEQRNDFYLRGTGDVSEQHLARRVLTPGYYFESANWEINDSDGVDLDRSLLPTPFSVGQSDALSFRGGLQPRFSDASAADDLKYTVLYPDINHSEGRGPDTTQPYAGQPYATIFPDDAELRLMEFGAQFNSVPNGPGALFDPNVFPAVEHDVWSGGAKALFDDPEYARYLGTTNTNGPFDKHAYTWRYLGGFNNSSRNGANDVADSFPLTINGTNSTNPEGGSFRSIRPYLTTVNGVSPLIRGVSLVDGRPNGPADNLNSYGDASSIIGQTGRSLARTIQLLRWTADPVYMANSDLGSSAADLQPVAGMANTDSVRELMRTYYHVLADPDQRNSILGLPLPRGYDGGLGGGGQDLLAGSESTYFRNVLRYDPTVADAPGLSAAQVTLLRSAILAVNTKDLRDADNDVTVYMVDLGPIVEDDNGNGLFGEDGYFAGNSSGSAPAAEGNAAFRAGADNVTAIVYGIEPQPYITEVMVWDDTSGTATSGVAIELHNPYGVDIDISDWYIAGFGRTQAAPGTEERTDPTAAQFFDLSSVPVIPAGGFAVISSVADDATAPGSGTNYNFNGTVIAGLEALAGTDVHLLRPSDAAGTGPVVLAGEEQRTDEVESGLSSNQIGYAEGTAAADMKNLIPVDQVDLTGMDTVDARFYYARFTGAWEMVYPGRYEPNDVAAATPNAGPTAQFGAIGPEYESFGVVDGVVQADVFVQNLLEGDYRDYTDGGYLGTPEPSFGAANVTESVVLPTGFVTAPAIQVQNFRNDAALGTTDGTAAPEDRFFPFGMFGRDGDLLQVTMFGSYKLVQSPPDTDIVADNAGNIQNFIDGTSGRVIELTSPSMDLYLMGPADPVNAVDTDGDGSTEVPGFPDNPGRFDPRPNNLLYANSDEFSRNLFTYMRAHQGAANDWFPMVRPEEWGPLEAALPAGQTYYDYTIAAGPSNIPNELGTGSSTTQMPAAAFQVSPKPIDNNGSLRRPFGLSQANDDTERALPIEGRINIATAPAEVLAMLPLVVDDEGNVDRDATHRLAYDIANHRDGIVPTTYDTASAAIDQFGANPVEFFSIFDLLDVDAQLSGIDFDDTSDLTASNDVERLGRGDFSPFAVGTETGPATDFEVKYNRITRLSNLITTQSDAYDVYIVVQAWRIDEANPENTRLVDERRGQFRIARTRPNGGFAISQFAVPPKD